MTVTTDQHALTRSQAGMRFIAQTTFYNAGNWPRLAVFVREGYAEAALTETDAEARLAQLQALYAQIGRMHVLQVLGTDPHHVVVLVEEEHMPEGTTGASLIDLVVEPEYPHRILAFDRAPIAVTWTGEDAGRDDAGRGDNAGREDDGEAAPQPHTGAR